MPGQNALKSRAENPSKNLLNLPFWPKGVKKSQKFAILPISLKFNNSINRNFSLFFPCEIQIFEISDNLGTFAELGKKIDFSSKFLIFFQFFLFSLFGL